MNNPTLQSFRLRTMSYRHFRNVSEAYHRAIDGDPTAAQKRAIRHASEVAFFYHETLAISMDDEK